MRSDAQALVSVIVPTYNSDKFLDQCLDSISGQTHPNLEILCVNDGSTDSSLSIMREHARRDERIRIIDKENGGYGAACNRGISEAKGDWISIVEPDDWIDPTMYADMLAFAATFDDEIDIIKTPWWDLTEWDDPSTLRVNPCLLANRFTGAKRPFTLAEHPELIEVHPAIWSAIYSTRFLARCGIRFPEYPGAGWADNPFLIDTMAQARSIIYLDRAYYRYRMDLPEATVGHATPELVTRPFDRWVTMLDRLRELHVTDPGILESHYMRGFMYVDGAMYDDGKDNPLVVAGAKRVFGLMDEHIVLSSAKISGRRKKEYCDVLGKRCIPHIGMRRIRQVLSDSFRYVRVHGFSHYIRERVEITLFGRKHPKNAD